MRPAADYSQCFAPEPVDATPTYIKAVREYMESKPEGIARAIQSWGENDQAWLFELSRAYLDRDAIEFMRVFEKALDSHFDALAEELAEAHLNHEFLPHQWRERALMEGFDAWARNMYGWEKRR